MNNETSIQHSAEHAGHGSVCMMPEHGSDAAAAECCRPSSPKFMGPVTLPESADAFWADRDTWWRASKNTLNCLIGCMIGDFGMLFFLQIYYPETPIFLAMAMAMATGLVTSVIFETLILKTKEGFAWPEAFKVAFSMSIISMLGMELAANTTDYLLTGGTASPAEPWFWVALGIALVVGFLAPLPYNYYKLQKHGKACH